MTFGDFSKGESFAGGSGIDNRLGYSFLLLRTGGSFRIKIFLALVGVGTSGYSSLTSTGVITG